MKFIDTAKLKIKSGKGGPGCASMRREKYIEFGGPNGGDGGRGGSVYIVGNPSLTSLYDLRLHPHQKAGIGTAGMGDQKTGKSGKDKIINVPYGTIIIDNDTDEICMEILSDSKYLLLNGGKGGLGNVHFKSSTNRAPRYAQPGEPGSEMTIRLELKLIADVGLVGLPNAGKSTLISSISNARPKIADYPFTTLVPNLGVVSIDSFKSFVVADIPGIIEDAHKGTGLGDRFLKHIQRTSVLALLIDTSSLNELDPIKTYEVLLKELSNFSADLTIKKRIILLTKLDAVSPELDIEETIQDFKQRGEEVYPISSVSRKGLDKLIYRLNEIVETEKSIASEA